MPWSAIRTRPRLFICAGLGILAWAVQPSSLSEATRLLIAWNIAIWVYLGLIGLMMGRETQESIRQRALDQDESKSAILVLSVATAAAITAAIVAQLGDIKSMAGFEKAAHLSLAVATIVSAWSFLHLMFALHYAHEYSIEWHAEPEKPEQIRGGLDFPDTNTPSYADFCYFSYVIGVASQTADVEVTSPAMRRVVLVHGVLSFFFNTTVLALTINIAAGLI